MQTKWDPDTQPTLLNAGTTQINKITHRNEHKPFPSISWKKRKKEKTRKRRWMYLQFAVSKTTHLPLHLPADISTATPSSVPFPRQHPRLRVWGWGPWQHCSSPATAAVCAAPALCPLSPLPPLTALAQCWCSFSAGSGSRARLTKALLLSLFCRVIFNLDQSQIQFALLSHK